MHDKIITINDISDAIDQVYPTQSGDAEICEPIVLDWKNGTN